MLEAVPYLACVVGELATLSLSNSTLKIVESVVTHASLINFVLLVDVTPSILGQAPRAVLPPVSLVSGVMVVTAPPSR